MAQLAQFQFNYTAEVNCAAFESGSDRDDPFSEGYYDEDDDDVELIQVLLLLLLGHNKPTTPTMHIQNLNPFFFFLNNAPSFVRDSCQLVFAFCDFSLFFF